MITEVIERPDVADLDDILKYLDDLRDSGATNMFGAAPYLVRAFALNRNLANNILGYWMQTFSLRHPSG